MSKIKLTVKQIKDLELWDRVCEYKGWSQNNSKSDEDIIEFDSKLDAEFTEKEVEVLEKIKTRFSQLYKLYFDLSPEIRYKIENTENLSLRACIDAGTTTVFNVLRKINKYQNVIKHLIY